MKFRDLSIALGLLLFFGCARQTTPTGGPQDKTPPVLMNSVPANNEVNYKGKTITLTFNEALKLKEPKEEIIIAPSLGKDVTFIVKQNRVIITSKNALADSTTYSFLFREGIQDITEGNAPEDLRLAFSTGPILDSLSIRGTVSNALDEKIPEKITVAIFSSDTFNIFKHKPVYFTKIDKQGGFIIRNLKPGSYKIYAFQDKNKNLKLETKTEAFGFLPGKIELTRHVDSLHIALISLDARPIALTNVRHNQKISRVVFNKGLLTYATGTPNKSIINSFGDSRSEIEFFHYDPINDSIPITLHALDSINQSLDTVIYVKTGNSAPSPENFKPNFATSNVTLDPPTFKATITFNKPITHINFDSLQLRIDTIRFLPIVPKDITYDTLTNTLTVLHPIPRKTFDSIPNGISFFAGKAAFISIDSDSSKHSLITVPIPLTEELASLSLEVQTKEANYIVELLTSENKISVTASNQKSILFKNLTPASYKVRIIIDTNHNGQWDPGNILKDLPPEPTYFYKNTDGKYLFPLRANWEVGPYLLKF